LYNEQVEMPNTPHTILIISGGAGASAEQIVHTVLAQFPDSPVRVSTISNVRFPSQIDEAVSQAQTLGATLVHTLVDAGLRAYLVAQSRKQSVTEIDLMGPLIEQLVRATGQEPLNQPGLYRKLNKAYFERVAAIEYTIRHDDGQRPETWSQAEVLLLGVSRSGKTPLSLYLSVLGWKAANLPLVPGLELPAELFQLERRRVLGLKIEAGQLLAFRQQRQQRLGVSGPTDYTNLEKIYEELEYAAKIYRQNGFTTIQVTDKPLESIADEIIRLIGAT
jgi:[pyruvate, water dikinase]-phosphate phosphotransferase / [pyruvate, water dikinase] kinase